jgi:hypothetical protein
MNHKWAEVATTTSVQISRVSPAAWLSADPVAANQARETYTYQRGLASGISKRLDAAFATPSRRGVFASENSVNGS